MRTIFGIKLGGLQQKIINLMLIFIAALIGLYMAVFLYQQKQLSAIVQEAGQEQQTAMTAVSEETMQQVLQTSMSKTTALQAYIANDLFSDVKTDVATLQAFATDVFLHRENFPPHAYYAPDAANDGIPSVQAQHERGMSLEDSKDLSLVANMSEVMLAMFKSSDKLNSCFVATTDGCILFVDDRSGSYFTEEGEVTTFQVRERSWYLQALQENDVFFTGVEMDAFTGIAGLVCAAPVYVNGELVAVVGADIFLTSISEYIRDTATEGGFLCVISDEGQVLFSPREKGVFKAELSGRAQDLRENENEALASFVKKALAEQTDLTLLEVEGKEYYMVGAPLKTLGWTVVSVVEKEIINQPTKALLAQYDEINQKALDTYAFGLQRSRQTLIVMTITIVLLAITGALALAGQVVRPLEHMTRKINSMGEHEGETFEMEKVYRTNDEIEILAESFADLTHKAQDYITQITTITAEKERIGTELALATRIQADMLPNIFPAFPEREEFDIYATMDPAKEVGGDFYDFFLIDDTHLGLVIADVSGKGVPAALFMMISKILVQNYAMTGHSPKEVLKAVNQQICSNNREEMFVTVWLGILDTTTGKVVAANAGHEYPVIMQTGEEFQLLKDKHGLVIGAMDIANYREYELTLTPGSKLFVYTDGVPEATNSQNEMFGTERMVAALNEAKGGTPDEILKSVRQAVDAFVGDAEQFDDLTMMCLTYLGPKKEEGGEEHLSADQETGGDTELSPEKETGGDTELSPEKETGEEA